MFKLYKGSATVLFTTINGNNYVIWNGIEESKVKVSKKKGNALYLQLLSEGWKRVATPEAKVASPKNPTTKKTPKWNFGEAGFDYNKYIETAKKMGAGYAHRQGGVDKFHVYKNMREEVYKAMGATLNA